MSDLKTIVTTDPQGILLKVVGALNVANVQALNDSVNPIVAQRPKLVVIDLSGVDLIGSLGMGAILTFRKALERNGGTLFVAAATPLVLDALARARLAELLNIRGTVEAAFADGSAMEN